MDATEAGRHRTSLNRTHEALDDVADWVPDVPEVLDTPAEVGEPDDEVLLPGLPTEAFGLKARVVFDDSAHSIPPEIWLIKVAS